jgi:hypothetical protein
MMMLLVVYFDAPIDLDADTACAVLGSLPADHAGVCDVIASRHAAMQDKPLSPELTDDLNLDSDANAAGSCPCAAITHALESMCVTPQPSTNARSNQMPRRRLRGKKHVPTITADQLELIASRCAVRVTDAAEPDDEPEDANVPASAQYELLQGNSVPLDDDVLGPPLSHYNIGNPHAILEWTIERLAMKLGYVDRRALRIALVLLTSPDSESHAIVLLNNYYFLSHLSTTSHVHMRCVLYTRAILSVSLYRHVFRPHRTSTYLLYGSHSVTFENMPVVVVCMLHLWWCSCRCLLGGRCERIVG